MGVDGWRFGGISKCIYVEYVVSINGQARPFKIVLESLFTVYMPFWVCYSAQGVKCQSMHSFFTLTYPLMSPLS